MDSGFKCISWGGGQTFGLIFPNRAGRSGWSSSASSLRPYLRWLVITCCWALRHFAVSPITNDYNPGGLSSRSLFFPVLEAGSLNQFYWVEIQCQQARHLYGLLGRITNLLATGVHWLWLHPFSFQGLSFKSLCSIFPCLLFCVKFLPPCYSDA